MTQEEMLKLLSTNLKYSAYVYNQISTVSETWEGEYKIEYLYDKVPNNSLLFMVPQYSSIESRGNKTNRLVLKYLVGTKMENGELKSIYKSRTYEIYKENSEGILSKVTKGDIIANRLVIFRFINGDSDSVILVNNPLYNDVSISTLTVTNAATFFATPCVVEPTTKSKIPLATNIDLINLEKRVKKLEDRFQYGTADPEDVLINADIGTIYIQVEEGE